MEKSPVRKRKPGREKIRGRKETREGKNPGRKKIREGKETWEGKKAGKEMKAGKEKKAGRPPVVPWSRSQCKLVLSYKQSTSTTVFKWLCCFFYLQWRITTFVLSSVFSADAKLVTINLPSINKLLTPPFIVSFGFLNKHKLRTNLYAECAPPVQFRLVGCHAKLNSVSSRAATGQIIFGSVLIFDVGFRLFRFGSSNCILFVFTSKTCTHNVNVYIFSTTNIKQ